MLNSHKPSHKNILYLLLLSLFFSCFFYSNLGHTTATETGVKLEFNYAPSPGTASQNIVQISVILPQGYYTYAPSSVEDAEKDLNVKLNFYAPRAELTAPHLPIEVIYPQGIKRADLLDSSKEIYAYEQSFSFFLVIPSSFLTANIDLSAALRITLCSKQNCIPLTEKFKLTWPSQTDKAGQLNQAILLTQADQSGKSTEFTKLNSALAFVPEAWQAGLGSKIRVSKQVESNQLTKAAIGSELNSAELKLVNSTLDLNQQTTLPKFLPRYFSSFEPVSLFSALGLGFLAGLILNLMPCVLPVLSLKVASFMHSAGQNANLRLKTFQQHNLLFALGILSWFGVLALVVGGFGYAWGGFFQSIALVYSLLLLIFLLSLSLFEVFNLPILDLKMAQSDNPKLQAYLTGLMATLLATPCSGPLLGGVLGFASLAPLGITLLIFLCMGLGMALPYLVLAMYPNLSVYLPKPGAWTLYLERILGFFLLGTAIYLLSILPSNLHLPILMALLTAALAAWLWGLCSLRFQVSSKIIVGIVCLGMIFGSSWWALTEPAPEPQLWQEYSQAEFLSKLGKEPLLVEFTAAWCPTCKVLEQTVLTPSNLQELQKMYKLQLIKVDLTQSNAEQEAFLRSLGSVSIPLTAIFSPGVLSKSPIVLRDIYTLNQLQQALKTLGKP